MGPGCRGTVFLLVALPLLPVSSSSLRPSAASVGVSVDHQPAFDDNVHPTGTIVVLLHHQRAFGKLNAFHLAVDRSTVRVTNARKMTHRTQQPQCFSIEPHALAPHHVRQLHQPRPFQHSRVVLQVLAHVTTTVASHRIGFVIGGQ
jgi:hypothetical protein